MNAFGKERLHHLHNPPPSAIKGALRSMPVSVVRPQSAMGLTSPSNDISHSRSHSKDFSAGCPQPLAQPWLGQNFKEMKQTSPTKAASPNRSRGSYNPHYASGLDSKKETHKEHNLSTNPAYSSTSHAIGSREESKGPIPKPRGQDLRSAWQRLYGHETNRHHTADQNVTHVNKALKNDGAISPTYLKQENYHISHFTEDSLQYSSENIREKQVAGPMVAQNSHSGRQTPPGQCSPNFNPLKSKSSYSRPPSASGLRTMPTVKKFTSPQNSDSLGPASKYPDSKMGLRLSGRFDSNPIQQQMRGFENEEQSGWSGRKNFRESSIDNKELPPATDTSFSQNMVCFSGYEKETEDTTTVFPADGNFFPNDSEYIDSTETQMNRIMTSPHLTFEGSLHDKKSMNKMHGEEVVKSKEKVQTKPSARSQSLEDLRESDEESNVSFDIENTVLMVDPSDQSELGTNRSKQSDVNSKLKRLEGMYATVMRKLDDRSVHDSRGRRWSIGSSDTNSIRYQVHHSKRLRSTQQHPGGQDMKHINKRFQRLESHVVTLARSIAHLSSELRTQSNMSREIQNVKREIQELKISSKSNNNNSEGKRQEFLKNKSFNNLLTNPRQVKKLTRFFGQEPSWLEIFLTRLGYEQYVKNFDQEQIGMLELPYMTEDQLKSIGIPMGPRARILQESQMCFKDEDFNLYIV